MTSAAELSFVQTPIRKDVPMKDTGFPPGNSDKITGYHAHIYYDEDSRESVPNKPQHNPNHYMGMPCDNSQYGRMMKNYSLCRVLRGMADPKELGNAGLELEGIQMGDTGAKGDVEDLGDISDIRDTGEIGDIGYIVGDIGYIGDTRDKEDTGYI